MRLVLVTALVVGLGACRTVETTPLASFQASCSAEIQHETRALVLKAHRASHAGCPAPSESLRLIGYRTILAKNDSEDYVATSVVRWAVDGCGEPFIYETRMQRIRRHLGSSEKNYGISLQPIYERPGASRAQPGFGRGA
ncbi:hypothetical protein [Geothrix sp.]|jgi:hypothetical protein|uniref:hypothetical protein n=1 Tax=Geothrix sp. TaxID=1962974 RepID=UPI0025BE7F14|nr:hypothetical protein [Geothrix sp.]